MTCTGHPPTYKQFIDQYIKSTEHAQSDPISVSNPISPSDSNCKPPFDPQFDSKSAIKPNTKSSGLINFVKHMWKMWRNKRLTQKLEAMFTFDVSFCEHHAIFKDRDCLLEPQRKRISNQISPGPGFGHTIVELCNYIENAANQAKESVQKIVSSFGLLRATSSISFQSEFNDWEKDDFEVKKANVDDFKARLFLFLPICNSFCVNFKTAF